MATSVLPENKQPEISLAKKNQIPEPKETQRKKLADDIETFLQKGGMIDQIESGVSGVSFGKPADKSIKLGKPK